MTVPDGDPGAVSDGDPGAVSDEGSARRVTRRRQIAASVLLAAAAVALWAASRMTWATVLAADGLSPERTFDVLGAQWSPWLTPLALVLLAAILAALSVRGWGLRVIAVLIAVAGLVVAFPAISLLTEGADSEYAARAADIPERYQVLLITVNSWASMVVLIGAMCAVGAGVMLLRAAGGGTRFSSKYTTPAARREELERQIFAEHEQRERDSHTAGSSNPSGDVTSTTGGSRSSGDVVSGPPAIANERMMWDALDTGIDPTDAGGESVDTGSDSVSDRKRIGGDHESDLGESSGGDTSHGDGATRSHRH